MEWVEGGAVRVVWLQRATCRKLCTVSVVAVRIGVWSGQGLQVVAKGCDCTCRYIYHDGGMVAVEEQNAEQGKAVVGKRIDPTRTRPRGGNETRRGPLHPGATRKMLRNFGVRGGWVAMGRWATLGAPGALLPRRIIRWWHDENCNSPSQSYDFPTVPTKYFLFTFFFFKVQYYTIRVKKLLIVFVLVHTKD